MKSIHHPLYFGSVLFFLNFLVILDHLVVIPLVLEIAKSTGMAETHSGYLIAIYPVAAGISALLISPLSDRIGRKRLLTFLILGFVMASYGFAMAKTPFELFLFRILQGAFGGPIMPNSMAFVGDSYHGPSRGKILANLALTFSAANILGVPLGAWINGHVGWSMVFVLLGSLALVCLILFLWLPGVAEHSEKGFVEQLQELWDLTKLDAVRKTLWLQFFLMVGLFGYVPNIALWLSTNYHYSPQDIAFCYMQGGIGAILGNRIAYYFTQRDQRQSLITGGSILMAVILAINCSELVPSPPFGFFFAAIMFGASLRIPPFQLYLVELMPTQLRGRLISLNMIVSFLAMGLGGFWSSPLLRLEAGHLYGMPLIGVIAAVTLLTIPFWMKAFLGAAGRLEKY